MFDTHRLMALLAWIWAGYASTLLILVLFATLD
jgi:hypothetical protein